MTTRSRGTRTWATAAHPEAAQPTAPLVLFVLVVLIPIKPTATRATHAKPVVTRIKPNKQHAQGNAPPVPIRLKLAN